MTDVDASLDESRKRKIDTVLSILDKSKFIPLASASPTTFAPWDRSCLSARLCTFYAFPIHAAASPINAYTLSRRGWTCLDATTISCGHCHARIVIHTCPRPDTMAILAEKFNARVVAGHVPKCPWSTRGCHETLLRVPLADSDLSMDAFQRRLTTFDELASVKHGVLANTTVRGANLPDSLGGLDRLALLGWSCKKVGTLSLLVCQDCHRRLKVPAQGSLDAVEEHYDYCPWVSAKTQGTESGWSLLLKHWIKVNTPEVATESSHGQLVVCSEVKDSREQVRQVRQKLGFE